MDTAITRIIREDLTTEQVMKLRSEEIRKGNQVNIRRIHSSLVEIEIIQGADIIDITPTKTIIS
ncbi:MAG: hypothetical protein V3U78_07890 [Thiotrichaceae bacterium]